MSARGLALAELPLEEGPQGEALRLGVIGCGLWGREILETLSRAPWAKIVAVCDTYPAFLKRGQELAPAAKAVADYRQLLALPELEAAVVATPSHQHREIALDVLAAGKHLYCEAPLATTVEDARAIALAAKGAKTVFQGGLQGRSNLLYRHVSQFVRAGVLGSEAQVTGRWSRKDSWRRAAPTPTREAEINWRLAAASSAGLPGEVGLHQIDLASRYLGALPEAVHGFGSTVQWRDGRDVADTVHCVLDYPKGVRLAWSATLASSVAGCFTLFQGSNSSVMLREARGWLIKEADSPLLGWEVYAGTPRRSWPPGRSRARSAAPRPASRRSSPPSKTSSGASARGRPRPADRSRPTRPRPSGSSRTRPPVPGRAPRSRATPCR